MIDTLSINFHDTLILRVTEDTESDLLVMDVDYPVDYMESKYERRRLIFTDAYNYQVHEQPFEGSPAILSVKVIEQANEWGWMRLQLDTNAGFREISCKDIKLD